MRTQAKWLQSATMMAFLAVVALFVSPVLALGCACSTPVALHQNAHACCQQEAAHQAATLHHHDASAAQCAFASDDCLCNSDAATAAYIPSDTARFFAPIIAALPVRFDFSFEADTRRIAYAHFAARPRAPDRTLFSGRAPPALALS